MVEATVRRCQYRRTVFADRGQILVLKDDRVRSAIDFGLSIVAFADNREVDVTFTAGVWRLEFGDPGEEGALVGIRFYTIAYLDLATMVVSNHNTSLSSKTRDVITICL